MELLKLIKNTGNAPNKVGNRSGIRICMDIAAFLIAYCFYYTLMLFVFYFQYQAGNCQFMPLAYLPSILIFFLVHELIRRPENPWIAGISAGFAIFLTIILYPLRELKAVPGAILFVFAVVEFFSREKKIDKNGIGDALFLRLRNRIWGTGIIVLMVLHIIITIDGAQRAISPMYCLEIMCVILCVYFILFFLHKYMKMFYHYFRRKKQISFVMNEQVKRVLIFAGAFAAGVGVVIFIVSQYLSGALTKVFAAFIKWISGIELNIDKLDVAIKEAEYKSGLPLSDSGEIAKRTFEHSAVLSKLLYIILLLIVAAVLVYGIYVILRSFSKFKFVSDKNDDFATDRQEFIVSTRKSEKSFFFRHGDSLNEKIRRYYYKMLLYFRKQGKLKRIEVMTAGDIAEILSEKKEQKKCMEEFTPIYEIARYSNESATKESVDKAKDISNRMMNIK